jgi:hypothetical protein
MEIVDYAMPMMKIEKYLRQIHDLALARKYEEASQVCLSLTTESRILSSSLHIMQMRADKEDVR